jgi:hypothetical protein
MELLLLRRCLGACEQSVYGDALERFVMFLLKQVEKSLDICLKKIDQKGKQIRKVGCR